MKGSVTRDGSGLVDGQGVLLALSRERKLYLLVFPNNCVGGEGDIDQGLG